MSTKPKARPDSQRIGELQKAQAQDEFRRALRALLMRPLMAASHEDFPAVRRQAERLRDWFAREAGWPLHVERDGARLFKRPADLADATRGLPDYDRRRYVLLCLACAVLERADAQITLQLLGERLMELAGEAALASRGFAFTLRSASERRDLVRVCRTLLEYGVLQRVAGDEEHFINDSGGGGPSDALYDVQRRMLAGMLAAVRGPSTWATEVAPVAFEDRLQSLVAQQEADGEQGRRDALRHQLTRRLLDDPVLYTATLEADMQAYFVNQRGPLASRLCEATGLTPEQRAEGLALCDEGGQLTDVSMPAEGTEAHATLLVAEHLANGLRRDANAVFTDAAVAAFLRGAVDQYGKYWRKSAREPGAEVELAGIALDKLHRLQLISRSGTHAGGHDSSTGELRPLAAIARFAIGSTEIQAPAPRKGAATPSLFDL